MKEINLPWVQEQIPGVCFSITDELRKEIPLMSATYIIRYLQKQFSVRNELYGFSLADLQNLFHRDSHSCWYRKPFIGTRKPGKEDEEQRQGKGDENQRKGNIDRKPGNEGKENENSPLRPVQSENGAEHGEACKTAQKGRLTHNQGLLEEWKEVYVDRLCHAGAFQKLCGLIYFTDGYGIFHLLYCWKNRSGNCKNSCRTELLPTILPEENAKNTLPPYNCFQDG